MPVVPPRIPPQKKVETTVGLLDRDTLSYSYVHCNEIGVTSQTNYRAVSTNGTIFEQGVGPYNDRIDILQSRIVHLLPSESTRKMWRLRMGF